MIPIDDPAKIGAVIADLRIMNRYSQRALCAEVGMHQARLSDWETGRAIPSVPYLIRVSRALSYGVVLIPIAEQVAVMTAARAAHARIEETHTS